MSIMQAFEAKSDVNQIWDSVIERSKDRLEMGAFLIISPTVSESDKVGLNLQLHGAVGLIDGYQKDGGWCGACLEAGVMQLVARLDTINQIATRYPQEVRRYKAVRARAQKSAVSAKTKFIQTWQGHFRKPLLDVFKQKYCHENTHGF